MKPANLAELADQFSQHKDVKITEQKSFSPLPAGHYTVTVAKAMWDEAKTTETPCILWHLKVVDGDHAGRMMFKRNWLKEGSEANMRFLAQDLKLVIGEMPKLDDPGLMNKLLDKVLFVKKQGDGDRDYEVWINGVDRRVEAENPAASSKTLADDDIPF